MAATGKEREERAARERARTYAARQQLHERQVARRRRDNVIAGVAGGVLVLAIAGAQFAYDTAGPGAPAPTDTSTPTREPATTTPLPGGSTTTDPIPASPDATPAG